MPDVWLDLKPRISEFEAVLRIDFDEMTIGTPGELIDAMAYSLFAGGKRLRPVLAILACEAVGGKPILAFSSASAVEMIHTYSLIHDDLPAMDDDDLRRGRPTCHKVYGEAMAILAGDGLQALAFGLLAKRYQNANMLLELMHGSGTAGMVGGQVLDLIAEGRIQSSSTSATSNANVTSPIEKLERIHQAKTGALIRSSVRLGALAGNADEESMLKLSKYADLFGLLFQLTDDLLDVTGSAEVTGKKTGKDSARGKLTYPSLLGVFESQQLARQLAEECGRLADHFGQKGVLLKQLADFVVSRDK